MISQHECKDDVARTLWSISSDFVVGHEIAHAILHCHPAPSAEREIQADQAGLFALWAALAIRGERADSGRVRAVADRLPDELNGNSRGAMTVELREGRA